MDEGLRQPTELLIRDVRLMLEEEPPPGLWKLTDEEMSSLAAYLTRLIHQAHSRGWDEGYDSCVGHLIEGAEAIMDSKHRSNIGVTDG